MGILELVLIAIGSLIGLYFVGSLLWFFIIYRVFSRVSW